MTRPVIGITSGGRSEGYIRSRHYTEFYSTPAPYVDAVRRAGGVALLIPPGEAWEEVLPLLHGIVVTGGTDIDPARYGGDPLHPHILPVDCERDDSELDLARHLLAVREMPILCICRGLQVLNVAAGGTLYEHIPDVHELDIHRDEAGLWAMQDVHVEADSLIAEVMGVTKLATSSGHHQAIRDLGEGLRVAAIAEDGIIEAVEASGHPWLVAVQWHPEVTASQDASQQALFDALVAKAGEGRQLRALG